MLVAFAMAALAASKPTITLYPNPNPNVMTRFFLNTTEQAPKCIDGTPAAVGAMNTVELLQGVFDFHWLS
jgi:hypothetical protein